jgi:hypothetical protein
MGLMAVHVELVMLDLDFWWFKFVLMIWIIIRDFPCNGRMGKISSFVFVFRFIH